MYNSVDSIVINKPREHVFRVAETYPCFISFYRSGEILYQDEKTIKVKISSEILGVPTSWIGDGKKKRFETIDYTQTQGFFKGLKAIWSFQELGESTIVSIDINFKLNLPVIGSFVEHFMGTRKVSKTVKGILSELKREAESKLPQEILLR
jgi:ribosome-associated toxin RatA of RatAB toxin-antitoxin module